MKSRTVKNLKTLRGDRWVGKSGKLLCLPLQKSHLSSCLDLASATCTADSVTATIFATIMAAINTTVTMFASISTINTRNIFESWTVTGSHFHTKVMLAITDSHQS